MFLLFSRPIEFLGFSGFLSILIGFAVISVASWLLLPIFFWSKDETASKGEAIKSWLAGSAVLGVAFLIANLILAIPVIVILIVVQTSVIERFDGSDETFHKVDDALTLTVIAVNLICYFLAITIYHRKIYNRLFARRKN